MPCPAIQEYQSLEEVHILLILQQSTVERWNSFALVVTTQGLGRDIFRQQQFYPVEQFGCRRFLFQSGHLANLVKRIECLAEQVLLPEAERVRVDDGNEFGS